MITDRKACERIIKLLGENAKIRAIPNKCRSIPASGNKIKKTEELLAQTFFVCPINAEQFIKNPENLNFLCSMKSDRLASFVSQDKVLARKVHCRQQLDKPEATRQEKIKTGNTSCTAFSVNVSLNKIESSNSGSEDSSESGCESV